MPEFLELLPPDAALQSFLEYIEPLADFEELETKSALSRVAAADTRAPHPLPSFARSTVDGYAVRAADTYGADESLPVYVSQIGEVKMGASAGFSLGAAQCGLIHTGGMLPGSADAVVMVENTQVSNPGEIEILRSVAVGENVIEIGEDVAEGQVVIPAGSLLRPAEIGGLLALGITDVQVYRRPVVGIISTGDEVIHPKKTLQHGQVRDINSYSLSSLIERCGAIPLRYGIISDREDKLFAVTCQAVQESDILVVTAGSSASTRDLTAQVINKLGEPGVIVHGVNVRPGKPTILAGYYPSEGGQLVPIIGLPGNPVSALVIAMLFIEPVIDRVRGLSKPRIRPRLQANLEINLASKAGREDWVPVKLTPKNGGYSAEPIFGKSNLIFILARADGLLHIPSQVTGFDAGALVDVLLL